MPTLPEIISLLISLPIITLLIYTIYILIVSLVFGAPYSPSAQSRIITIIKLARIRPGEKAVDLGSGDGRIVFALAKSGAQATGLEINPILVLLTNMNIKRLGLEKKAHVIRTNLWTKDLSDYTLVTVYGMPHIMARLEKKLQRELRPGSRVVSNFFRFPTWKETTSKNDVYLYRR